jgi:hypothetical protein
MNPALTILGRTRDDRHEDHPTTTRAMISDSKLPFSSESTGVETPPEASCSASPEIGVAQPSESVPSRRQISTARLWLRRVGVLLFVFLCATVGVMLTIVPWRPEWSENPLLLPYPVVHDLVSSGFVRGLVTGLGLLNVWTGFWEALHYRED